MVPETTYARSGDLHIAYQVVGDGPIDLLWVPTWIWQIEHMWEWPMAAHDYANTRFSDLNDINGSNVKNLKAAWTFSMGVDRGQECVVLPEMIDQRAG